MRFGNISVSHFLWLLVGVAGFYLWAFKRRRIVLSKFAEQKLLMDLMPFFKRNRQKLKAVAVFVSIVLILFSFMRPQWGFKWQEVKRRGLDVTLLLDTSNSMLAEDVKPNRLERAKFAIKDFVKYLQGDRVGLVAFSGNAFLQCPLTVDYGGFLLSLDNVDVNTISRGGTSISGAIKEGLKSFENGLEKYKVMILITDGESHEGDFLKAAEQAKKKGVKIFCIGIGTSEGELIQITGPNGNKSFLKDHGGNIVKSRLDEVVLQKIALMTEATYVRAGAVEFGLDLIYREKLSKMEKRELKSKLVKQHRERFQIPLLIAFCLLVCELFISDRKRLNEK